MRISPTQPHRLPSSPPVAISLPSGLAAIDTSRPLAHRAVSCGWQVSASQTRAVPSSHAAAMERPSPLNATPEQLKGLPPALIQTAEFDVLRDEGEAYGRKLDAAGVDVTVSRYNGMIHDFGLLNVVSEVPAVRAAMRQAGNELKAHLK